MMEVIRTFYCTCGTATTQAVSTYDTHFTCPTCDREQKIKWADKKSTDPRQQHKTDPRRQRPGRRENKPL